MVSSYKSASKPDTALFVGMDIYIHYYAPAGMSGRRKEAPVAESPPPGLGQRLGKTLSRI